MMRETVVIIAGGPSVTVNDVRTIGLARAAERCSVIAVNDAVYPCWFADHLHACDARWWIEHFGVPGFAGAKTSLEAVPFDDVITLTNTGIEGFDPNPGAIRSGSNSGYQAVHIAAKAGARRIVLIGLDYTDDGARMHWFGTHKPGFDKHSDVVGWRRHLMKLTDELGTFGVTVVNAGYRSTLSWLPRVDLALELA
ncbi:hypothetical protein [Shinella zoogloeoides]|uniref:hypothetical protein n=1 Tax=Shinella zoogloeoides TaxID=352475 RepID=UPI00299E7AF9|nr:hypothetical protein [Shinella zoogloeoides]WPE19947.1 hypothetical protein ShzoTeo12_11270 [Shinella zoogloeoides]